MKGGPAWARWDWSTGHAYGVPHVLSRLPWTVGAHFQRDRGKRIQALGNGLVPQVAKRAIAMLTDDL